MAHRNRGKRNAKRRPGGVVDVFCGVGGLSLGFRRAGFKIAGGIDLDEAGRYAFERYTGGRFVKADVGNLDSSLVTKLLGSSRPRILIGCAPCRSFSEYNKKGRGRTWNLLPAFARLIEECDPDIVSMENVWRLLEYRGGRVFGTFVNRLSAAGYDVTWYVVSCASYGISQRRKRLVLFASKRGFVDLLPASHEEATTLRSVIGGMRRLAAGAVDAHDRFHRTQGLSDLNLRRLKKNRPGGTWRDWPSQLRVACHETKRGKEFASVYGRLRWDEVGPTITTQFFKVGCGRFGHPTQHRALSLREGAMLQTFPTRFQFAPPGEKIALDRIGRLIGNAVPVRLGEVIALSIKRHVEQHYRRSR